MRNLAVIPARGGSKRIPRKNIKDFLGKPVIAYSIQAAIKSGVLDEIMVSTDDDEIADIARKYGAKVPFMRPKNLADDYTTTADVLLEVIDTYSAQGLNYDYACCIYPAAPLISAEKLRLSYEMLVEKNVDSIVPVARFSYPIQRALRVENSRLEMIWPENMKVRSQDLAQAYYDSGQFYFFNVRSFIIQKSLYMDKTVPIELSEHEVQDIDELEDWKMAEIKYKLLRM